MKIDGTWVPESDAEMELFNDLHNAKVKAFENGVEPEQISAAMSYIASTSLVSKPEDNKKSLEDAVAQKKEQVDKCPECDREIKQVRSLGIGGEHQVQPCGHTFEWDQRDKIRGWVNDPTEDNE